jgi:hypothetical protein
VDNSNVLEPLNFSVRKKLQLKIVYQNVRVCAPLSKIREVYIKSFRILIKSSLQFACFLHETHI